MASPTHGASMHPKSLKNSSTSVTDLAIAVEVAGARTLAYSHEPSSLVAGAVVTQLSVQPARPVAQVSWSKVASVVCTPWNPQPVFG